MSGRSARLRAGLFAAEGAQAAREAAATDLIRELYLTQAAADRHPEIAQAARNHGARVAIVPDDVLAAMSDTVTPQGLVAVCSLLAHTLDEVIAATPRLVVVLSQVRDPGNAGAVVRAADAAGADAVILTQDSVDVHNPKCVRASAGSLFHLPVVSGVPLGLALSELRAAGLIVLAADGHGEVDLDDLLDGGTVAGRHHALSEPTAWIFGNEAWGMPPSDRALADAVVAVPVHGRAESLNLATAATVCLYASARAHRRQR